MPLFKNARALRVCMWLIAAAASITAAPFAAHAENNYAFDLPAQSLADSLRAIGSQAGVNVVFEPSAVRDKQAPTLHGNYSVHEALTYLLDGSGLNARTTEGGTFVIEPPLLKGGSSARSDAPSDGEAAALHLAQAATANSENHDSGSVAGDKAVPDSPPSSSSDDDQSSASTGIKEIVVTGTNIRGVKDLPTPTIVITREDIQRAGFTNTEDIFRSLPQNLADISSLVPQGEFVDGLSLIAYSNYERAAGVNLRGIGADATLTLVNGKRRAPSILGQVVDVSVIPVSVIERVETVTGGRSAVYGSDAVAGVVNIVTRRDFEGLETGTSYGAAAQGGGRLNLSAITGTKSDRAGFVVAYDYSHDELLDYVDLGLVGPGPYGTPVTIPLQPKGDRHSAYLSGRLSVSDRLELHMDGLYTHKEFQNHDEYLYIDDTELWKNAASSADIFSVSGGANIGLGSVWQLALTGTHSKNRYSRYDDFFYEYFGDYFGVDLAKDRTALNAVSAVVDGPLPAIGGMTPHVALGVERRREDFDTSYIQTITIGGSAAGSIHIPAAADRTIDSAFAEFLLPIVEKGAVPGLRQLTFSAAARFDHYSDSGDTSNPQFGLIWEPAAGLTLKGAYSTSFQAPPLNTLSRPKNLTFSLLATPDPMVGGTNIPLLTLTGVDPNLGPAHAATWSIGLDFEPVFAPWARMSLSYYDVNFKDRIGNPLSDGTSPQLVLVRERNYAELITRNPTLADAAAVVNEGTYSALGSEYPFTPDPSLPDLGLLAAFPNLVIFDRRTSNIAVEKAHGLDLLFNANFETDAGDFNFGMNANYILEHVRALTSTSPDIDALNEIGKTPDLRMRANAGWTAGPWGVFTYLNHVRGYNNPLTTPDSHVASWTTADLTLSWDGAQQEWAGFLQGFRASLSVDNLFDQDPPKIAGTNLGLRYDAANANPVGRYISLRLNKRW